MSPQLNPENFRVAPAYLDGMARTLGFALILLSIGCAAAPKPKVLPPDVPPESRALHDEIARMDAAMGAAYDAHDHAALMQLFADDLEFYHDTGGLLAKAQVADGFQRVFGQSPDIRRELIPGSMQVYPIRDYGAIETGAHRFCHVENGKDDCGTFQFTHVWRKKDGTWQIARVLSYGH